MTTIRNQYIATFKYNIHKEYDFFIVLYQKIRICTLINLKWHGNDLYSDILFEDEKFESFRNYRDAYLGYFLRTGFNGEPILEYKMHEQEFYKAILKGVI